VSAITDSDIARGLGTDYSLLRSELTPQELDYLDRTRQFVDEVANGQVIEGKGAVRSVWPAQIELRGVRVPVGAPLPAANSFQDVGRVLASTRLTCAFAVLSHAVGHMAPRSRTAASADSSATRWSASRSQDRLVTMLADVTAMQL
jgi:hypothetical protein